jgi:hypothetical protein
LRYKSTETGEVIYRLGQDVSRNPTFDKSYDIAYWMEGKPIGKIKTENTDLVSLMNWTSNSNHPQKNSFRISNKVGI